MNLDKPTQQAYCTINPVPTHEQLKKIFKSRKNQKRTILKHLINHGHISTTQAYEMFIYAPASRVMELKELGFNIKTVQDYNLNGLATYYLIKSEVANNE